MPGPDEQPDLPLPEIAAAGSFATLGPVMVAWLRPRIRFDRFNIGLIDQQAGLFSDAFVCGTNVAGRPAGHQRPLRGTVVEAGIAAGKGVFVGGTPAQLLRRFPGFGPVLDSGMRAMLAAPVRRDNRVIAALVLAATDAVAFDDSALDRVAALAAASGERIADLFRQQGGR